MVRLFFKQIKYLSLVCKWILQRELYFSLRESNEHGKFLFEILGSGELGVSLS